MLFQHLCSVCATSNRCWNDVVCQQGRGFILCHWQKSGKPLWFAPKSKRSLKFNPLKVHQLLHIVVLLLRHGFPWRPWKGCNFHRLKEYSIKQILHKAHGGITFLTPLPNRLWIHHEYCLYPANLYDLISNKHKISYSPFVNFIVLQT